MKNLVLIVVAAFFVSQSLAQNTTTGNNEESGIINQSSVLVVPFESKMYFSDIDRDISQKTELNFHQIKAKFRAALDQNIYIALKKYHKPLSFYSIEPNEAKKELAYIYNSIGYKYEVMPKEEVVEKETVGKKLIDKFKKKEEKEEYIKAGVKNGEVVSQVDNREKYMKTAISNQNLMSNLDKQYKASYYVFVNQLDIKRAADQRYLATETAYQREIKVHYTIFDAKGNEVSSGAIKSRFESNQNDIDKIIKEQFPLIAERIVSNMMGTEQMEAKQ